MNIVYVVMLKTGNKESIARIFNDKEKAKKYIEQQKHFYYSCEWYIDTWRVF